MTLTIPEDANFAYRPVIESPEQMKSSFFLDVYLSAEQHINSILSLFKSSKSDGLQLEYSNIIAFTGDRGAGKTSVMGNIKELLHSGKKLNGTFREKESFLCLPMIDPSHISPDETVIDIVLSRMYSYFDEYCNKNNVFTDRKRNVYQAFSETFQAVRVVCQNREARHNIPDSLVGLQNATAGNNLRELMSKLVNLLLQETGFQKDSVRCLVLCIDDIDMNIQQGYNICEELRKYLNIPNVIILFSLYIGQMNDLVRQQYLKDFDTLLRYREEIPLSESVPDMAKKYLEKLIPFNHRCALPEINFRNLKGIMIQYEGENSQSTPLLDELLRLLYEKSGLILVKNQDGTHDFLPTSLRGVTHLITLLRKMEPVTLIHTDRTYQLDEKERERLEKNLDTLARYIREYSIIEFSKQSAAILEALLKTPQENLNLRVIHMMNSRLKLLESSLPGQKPTVGDVLYIMRLYSRNAHSDDGKTGLFSALFKVLYSIRLLQTFLIDEGQDASLDERKLKLHQVLGGLVYNIDWDDVCRGSDLCEELSINNLKELEHAPDFENLLDELLVGTICMGRPESKRKLNARNNTSITQYLNNPDRDDKDISREALTGKRGNTFQYFIYSYLGCILSPLRNDLAIQNQDYQTWRKKYLSLLPILSADCIDAYVCGLRRATMNLRKSSPYISIAVSKGSRELIHDLIERSCIDCNSKVFWSESLDTFPFMQEDSLVEKHFFFRDSSGQPSVPEADPQKIDSLNHFLQKLHGMRKKYRSITDLSWLVHSYENTDTSGKLQEVESEQLKKLSDRLKALKAEYRNQSWTEEDAFQISKDLKDKIDAEIYSEIQNATEELMHLKALQKEPE